MLKPILIGTSLLLTLAFYYAYPAYQFFVYAGKAPFSPHVEFLPIPEESPTTSQTYATQYQETGDQVLPLLIETKHKINAPAISAAVAIDGKLVWAGASGWSDIKNEKAVTLDSQFRIGSTSKALTSTVLARMVDQGSINIDKPINTYFPDLPNGNWQDMTSRQLASHTAGVPHYKENTDNFGLYQTMALQTRYNNVLDALDVFDASELLFEPGEEYSYSSLGTVLLSAVMQKAGNKPFLQLVNENVIKPLNLTSTNAGFLLSGSEHLVNFYWNNKGAQNSVTQWRDVDLSHRLAGGGFVSTPSDLVKIGSAFLQQEFISAQTQKQFWTPEPLKDGTLPPHNYSVGWRVIKHDVSEEFKNVTIVNHGGVSRGSQSWLMILPEYQMSVALNINSNTKVFWDFASVSMDIARLFLLHG